MNIKIRSVYSRHFAKYGKVLQGYDIKELLEVLEKTTDKPSDKTIYVPGDKNLESLSIAKDFSLNAYGGMSVQIGYCNGNNTRLNCLEYHKGSELNVSCDDMILLLAQRKDIRHNMIDTSKVEAFRVPKGVIVNIYETTLHYAPCNDILDGKDLKKGFRVAVVLPQGTNTDKPEITAKNEEDKILWAKNKWLLAHPDSDEAKSGAYVGLTGCNINIASK